MNITYANPSGATSTGATSTDPLPLSADTATTPSGTQPPSAHTTHPAPASVNNPTRRATGSSTDNGTNAAPAATTA